MNRLVWMAAACMGLVAMSNAGAVIMLDVGSGPVMAGWTQVQRTNDWVHSTPVDLGDGVKVGFSNTYNVSTYDRSGIATSTLHVLGLDDLLRDFVTLTYNANPSSAGSLQIKGLTPGDYTVTLYGADSNASSETYNYTVNGSPVIAIGPATASPTLAKVTATVSVTVDATGMIEIGRPNTSPTSKLCGVVITPEPASLLILLAGAGLAAVRRR